MKDFLGEGISSGTDEEFPVNITFTIPDNANGVDTRMTTSEENNVEELIVVWFDTDGKYVHKAVGLETQHSATASICRVLMNKGTYNIMLFANSRTWFETIYPSGIPASTTMDQLSSAMIATTSETWGDNKIPMWGIKQEVMIDKDNDTVNGIYLSRALARIDINVDTSITSLFTMEEVTIYRNYRKGCLMPVLTTEYWNFSSASAIKPSLPTGNELLNTTGKSFTVTGGIELSNQIYVFETPAGKDLSSSSNDQNVCLVIKGKFNNGSSSYYRVDFAKNSSTTPVYIDLLRNNTYKITIKNVERDGASSADEALKGHPANIVYDISEVSKRGMNNIAWNGQHYLMASADTLSFWKNASSTSLRVQTNHASGWKVSNKPTWVTVTPDYSEYTAESTVTVAVQQNSSSAYRTGQIILTAGELELNVTIEQFEQEEFSLTIDPSTLVFYASPTEAKTVNVTTVPAGLTYTLTYNVGDITWTTQPANSLNATSFNLRPTNNTTGIIRTEVLTISVTHSDGRVIREDISIRQYPGNNPFSITTDSPYHAIVQSDAPLWVTCNQNWYFKRSVPSGEVNFNSLGVQPSGSALPRTFSITANDSYTDRDIVLVFSTWDDSLEHEETITQKGVVPEFYFINESMSNLYEHTFTGVTGETHDINFNLNFAWRFSENDMNTLVSSSSHAPGTVYPCAVISKGQQETLSVTPIDYTNRNGMPAAGEVFEATAHIYNENTSPYATSVQGTIKLNRTIPSVFDPVNITASVVGDIPRTGGTITFTAGSNDTWSIFAVQNGNTINSTTVAKGTYYETNSVSITIPENTDFGNGSDIEIYYRYNGQDVFVRTFRQEQYHLRVTYARGSHLAGQLYGVGDVLTFNIEGYYPDLQLRVVEESGGTAPSQIISVSAGTGESGLTFDIPRSDELTRYKVFIIQYSTDGMNWTSLNSPTQQYTPNYYGSNHFYGLGNASLTTMTWAEAMGIDTHYNNASYYNSYGNTDRANPQYTSTEDTGCGSYSEALFSNWKLPSPEYVATMLRLQINGEYDFGILPGQKFHTSYDNGMNKTRVYWIENGQVKYDDDADKNDVYYVRCVKKSN